MLIKLIKHKHLGNINNILFVLQDVMPKKPAKSITISGIKKYCSDKTLNLVYEIEGILALLEYVGIISRSGNTVKLDKSISPEWTKAITDILLARTIIERILVRLKNETSLNQFIPLNKIKFDTTLNQISIHNNSISLQYSSIKNLFIDLGGFKINPEYPNVLLIDISLQNHFESIIIPWLIEEREKLTLSRRDDTFSLEEFLELQELKNQHGAQAEEFVLAFEKKRLKGHPSLASIRRISNFDVGAGYDIVSYENLDSRGFDRFIEVKSFSKHPEFYWSKNEIRVAEAKRKNYFLYLIDRDQIESSNYDPLIIQDPYDSVFNHFSWQKDPQNWLVKKQFNIQTETATKKEIFVSYSHQNKPFVKKLVGELEENGYKVWWDYSTLKGGQDWQQEIQMGIVGCNYFIVVLTPDSVISDWVTNEITFASQKKKIIIPVKLKECEIPLAIIKKQYIEFEKQTYKAAFKELLELLNIKNRNIFQS